MSKPARHLSAVLLFTLGSAGCVDALFSDRDQQALSGAIFTSDRNGASVNQNIYQYKEDVYLDGGPGEGAPPGAAALPPGDYYFMVTDPSGMTLLSTDDISCRSFSVSSDGVITAVYSGTGGCTHATGVDGDHDELGAITVQLMPYADTPNPGGEYKVWVTPVDEYTPGAGVHGFIHSETKTDNFKVLFVTPPPPPPACGDGTVDPGEACDDGNLANGDGCSQECTVEVPPPPPPACGDGMLDAGEQCDDGNVVNGDGCAADCTIEIPVPVGECGDGVIDAGEDCDDGNDDDHDGCTNTCSITT